MSLVALHKSASQAYRLDFSPPPGLPAIAHATETGQILAPLGRLATNTGQLLRLGALRTVLAFGQGEGFFFRVGREQILYERWSGVTAWEELDPDLAELSARSSWDSSVPMFPSRNELSEHLKELKVVSWFGFRSGTSNMWNHSLKGLVLNQKVISQACLGLFQVDLILTTQQFPRTRLCLSFEQGRLWLWGSAKTDYLALATARTPSGFPLHPVIQLGEAFLIT